jgi:hypothetical protein
MQVYTSKSKPEETGIAELRRAAKVSTYSRESAFDGYTAEECLNMIRACWASQWDILPDELTPEEREYAALHGRIGDKDALDRRLSIRFGVTKIRFGVKHCGHSACTQNYIDTGNAQCIEGDEP